MLVELIGLDVAESVMLLGCKHEQVELRCAVSGPGKDAPCGELLAEARAKGAVKKTG